MVTIFNLFMAAYLFAAIAALLFVPLALLLVLRSLAHDYSEKK